MAVCVRERALALAHSNERTENHEKYSTESVDELCPWPFECAVVSSDMRTVPCCTIGNPDSYQLRRGKEFSAVWNSGDYVKFRETHLKGEIPSICRACYGE